jgi:hypothetical protein
MIRYCKDCKNCLVVNAADHYGLCILFNEEIKDTEYHSCTEFENRMCPNCGIDLLEGEIDDGVCATCGHSFGEEKK